MPQRKAFNYFPSWVEERPFFGTTPELYAPHLTAVASPNEVQALQGIADTSNLGTLTSTIQKHRMETNLETLLHMYTTPLPHFPQHDWHTPVIIALGVFTVLHIAYQLIFPYLHKLIVLCKIKQMPNAKPESPIPESSSTHQIAQPDTESVEPIPQVRYVKH